MRGPSAYSRRLRRLYSSAPWRTARLVRLALDGHTCTAEELDGHRCDETADLHVDHVVEAWVLLATGRDPCDVDYLQTLCPSHHAQIGALRRQQRDGLDGWLGELVDEPLVAA